MKKISILFISRSDRKLASSRVRVFDLRPYLQSEGIEEHILVNPRKKNFFKELGFLARLLWAAPRHDIVVLQKVIPSKAAAWLFRRLSKVMVYDIDDAMHVLHPSMQDSCWAKQRQAKGVPRLEYLLRKSDIVFCGNDYLAQYASRLNHHIEIVPSCIDIEEYSRYQRTKKDGLPVVFGWIGHDQNLVDFEPIKDALRTIMRELRGQAVLRIVSSKPLQIEGIDIEFIPWSVEGQYEAMASFDVGLMPLIKEERSLGRCGYKAIQYMGLGLPVVCSPVGDAGNVVLHRETGFHAQDTEQWQVALLTLARDPDLRHRMGKAGHQRAGAEYSYQAWAPKIASIMRRLLAART